jgi:hypothetical protein
VSAAEPDNWAPVVGEAAGRITVTWPHARVPFTCWPDVVEGWAKTVNGARDERDEARAERDAARQQRDRLLVDASAEDLRLRGLVGEALDLALRYLPHAVPPDPGLDPEAMTELLRIRREAGLT